jgi:hypothetical protein
MAASNQIFLVVDAGTPVAAFTARPRAESLPAAPARRLHKPAGLHVLEQSGTRSIMTMSAALAE